MAANPTWVGELPLSPATRRNDERVSIRRDRYAVITQVARQLTLAPALG